MLLKASLKSNIITVRIFLSSAAWKKWLESITPGVSIEWFLKDNLPLTVK